MSDLTPETALAMAHAGAHNEPEHYCRYPSSVTVPAEQMAAEVIRRLLILGFEVRRKEGPGDEARADAAEADRDEWKARANQFEATVEMLEARAEADLLNAEAAIARATQAEAQAAAMLGALEDISDGACDAPGYSSGCDMRCKGVAYRAIDTYGAIGRTLLAELEALRALYSLVSAPKWQEQHNGELMHLAADADQALHHAIVAVDAARTKTSGDTPNHPVPASGGRGNAEAAKNETAPLADRSKSAAIAVDAARKGE